MNPDVAKDDSGQGLAPPCHSVDKPGPASSTELDEAVLQAQGHTTAMPRSFSWVGAIGLSYSITNSWIGYTSCFGVTILDGGLLALIVCLAIATIIQWTITLGLAELASAFPSSGGQYHFTFILAPEKSKKVGAFIVGTINVIGWWVVTCSGLSLGTISTLGIVNFWIPSFQATQWQTYLIFLLSIFVTAAPVFLVPNRHLGLMTQASLYLSLAGFFIVMIVLLVMNRGINLYPNLVTVPSERSGWPTGIAWMLGIGNALYTYGGTDAVIHIAEEIPSPGRKLPQVLNMTLFIGMVTTIPLTIIYAGCIHDIDAVINSPLPSMELFHQATKSKVAATFLQGWATTVYYASLPSQWITCGRMAWAFARDKGLPFSSYWEYVDPRFNMPVRATVLSCVCCMVYGLLYIASTAAYNSILTTAVLALNITYCVPQAVCVIHGRSRLPKRYLNLGKYGYVCNIFAPCWVTIIGVFFCFPGELPTAAGSMNYTSVVLVVLLIIISALWFVQRHTFEGPKVDLDLLNFLSTEA